MRKIVKKAIWILTFSLLVTPLLIQSFKVDYFQAWASDSYQLIVSDTDTILLPDIADINISTVEVNDDETYVYFRLNVTGIINVTHYYAIYLDYDENGMQDHAVALVEGQFWWDELVQLDNSFFMASSIVWVVPKSIETDSEFTLQALTFNNFTYSCDSAPADGFLFSEWSPPYVWQVGVGIEEPYITDVYSDYGLDLDGDGLFEYLVFTVEVNVTIEGTYTVGITYLLDALDNYIYLVNCTTSALQYGVQNVSVYMSGLDLFCSGADGPYTISYLYLEDSTFRLLDWRREPYTTMHAYSYRDFEVPADWFPMDFIVTPEEATISFGGQETFTIGLWSKEAVSDVVHMDIAGIPSEWYTIESSVHIFPYGFELIPLSVAIPETGVVEGSYIMTVSVQSSNFNVTKTLDIKLIVQPDPVIRNLIPWDGAYVASNNVVFSWKTSSNCSTEVYLRPLGTESFTLYLGEYGTDHYVVVEELSPSTWYEFYVSSLSTAGYRTNSTLRSIFTASGTVFSQKIYDFFIERNYDQICPITVINTDNEPHEFIVGVSGIPEDLAISFVGEGSIYQRVLLHAGESKVVTLAIHAQDAQAEYYSLLLNLTNLGAKEMTDFAYVNLYVLAPVINFTIEETGSDSATLAKTLNITNYGHPLTDLSVFASEELRCNLTFQPNIDHAYLGTGRSITFHAIPTLWEGFTGTNGTIIASAAGEERRLDVDFALPGGKHVFVYRCPNITISFNEELDNDVVANTNPLNGSVVDSYEIDGIKMFGIYVAVDVRGGENLIYDAEMLLRVWNQQNQTVLSRLTDIFGVAFFSFHGTVGNYSYRAELPGYGSVTENRSFTVNGTSKFNASLAGIQWLSASDNDSYFNLTAEVPEVIELDRSPFMFTAMTNQPMVEGAVAVLLMRPIIEGIPEEALTLVRRGFLVDVEGTVEGNTLSFCTELVPNGVYTASIVVYHRTEINAPIFPMDFSLPITVNMTDDYVDNQLNYQYQRTVAINSTHYGAMNIQQQSVIVDPKKVVNLDYIDVEESDYLFIYYILSNQTMDDSISIEVRDQNGTLIHQETRPVHLEANVMEYLEIPVPIYDAYNARIKVYNITVTAADVSITEIRAKLEEFFGGPKVFEGISSAVGIVKCAVGLANPAAGLVLSGFDLAVNAYDMIQGGVTKEKAVASSANLFSVVTNEQSEGILRTLVGGSKLFTKVAQKAGTCLGVFGCASEAAKVLKLLFSGARKAGGTQDSDIDVLNCINHAPLTNGFPMSSGLQLFCSPIRNVEGVFVTLYFPLSVPDYYEPFDTIVRLNGHEIGTITNAVPQGYYIFEVDPSFLNYAETCVSSNTLTLDVHGMNRGYYVPLKGYTIHILFKQIVKAVVATNQSEADLIIADLCPTTHKADFGIHPADITVHYSKCKVGEEVTINVTVHNLGSLDVGGVPVEIFVDDNLIGNTTIFLLPAFSSRTITTTWNAVGGTHNIHAKIDPGREIDESDYANNNASMSISMEASPPVISNPQPANGSTTSDSTPLISADLSDVDSGINTSSAAITINGTGITENATVTSSRIWYASVQPLVNGLYEITAYVEDTCGNNNTLTWMFYVEVLDETSPIANAGPDQTVNKDTLVTFDGSASWDDVGIVNYTWVFVDVTPQTLVGVKPNYTFVTPGAYVVTLNVTDSAGNWDTDTVTITVRDVTEPVADAGSDQTIIEDSAITFDGSASSDNVGVTNYTWTFNDVTIKTLLGEKPTYTFRTPGVYTISLNVTDIAGNWATDTVVITVLDITKPVAHAGVSQTVNVGETVTFDAGNSDDNVGVISYFWDFGDGTNATDMVVTHVYVELGTYTVTLTVSDEAGNTDTHSITVTVIVPYEFPWLWIGVGLAIIAVTATGLWWFKIRKTSNQHQDVG